MGNRARLIQRRRLALAALAAAVLVAVSTLASRRSIPSSADAMVAVEAPERIAREPELTPPKLRESQALRRAKSVEGAPSTAAARARSARESRRSLWLRTDLPTGVSADDLELRVLYEAETEASIWRQPRRVVDRPLSVTGSSGDLRAVLPADVGSGPVRVELIAEVLGYWSGAVVIEGPLGPKVPLDLTLQPFGALTLEATLEHGLRPENLHVSFVDWPDESLIYGKRRYPVQRSPHSEHRAGTTRFAYERVTARTIALKILERRSIAEELECTVERGRTSEVDVYLRTTGPPGQIAGEITVEGDPDGEGTGAIWLRNVDDHGLQFTVSMESGNGVHAWSVENVPAGRYLVIPARNAFIHCSPRSRIVEVPATDVDFVVRKGPMREATFQVKDAATLAPIDAYWTEYDRLDFEPRRVLVRDDDRRLRMIEGAALSWTVRRPGYEPVQGTEADFDRVERRRVPGRPDGPEIDTWIADVLLRPLAGDDAERARERPLPRQRR
ncbi:MAG: hypothetical protein AAF726_19690 [Planctomycetota bacterium]